MDVCFLNKIQKNPFSFEYQPASVFSFAGTMKMREMNKRKGDGETN